MLPVKLMLLAINLIPDSNIPYIGCSPENFFSLVILCITCKSKSALLPTPLKGHSSKKTNIPSLPPSLDCLTPSGCLLCTVHTFPTMQPSVGYFKLHFDIGDSSMLLISVCCASISMMHRHSITKPATASTISACWEDHYPLETTK